jgi:outer membrane lipoprotein-sorting protein
MILKKLIIGILFLSFLNGCAQNMALLGPAYTLASSGSLYNAGLTYGSNEIITKTTGKTTSENLKKLLAPKKKDTEFQKLVKKNIIETRKKLKISNQ